MALIDVHNHITSRAFTSLLEEHGKHMYRLQRDSEGRTVVMREKARFMTFTEPMFDPGMRLPAMDEVGVGTQLLSYTCPNAYWAGPDVAERVGRTMNDHLAQVCDERPDRFRGLGSLPLQDVELSLRELDRCTGELRFVGLIILANVNETPLDDPCLSRYGRR